MVLVQEGMKEGNGTGPRGHRGGGGTYRINWGVQR